MTLATKDASVSESVFQLTRSRGAWPIIFSPLNLSTQISTHTLTWSVTFLPLLYYLPLKISTHTLTWSVTQCVPRVAFFILFQLTRSRGAWRAVIYCHHHSKDFNSHAHVERDAFKIRQFSCYFTFQLTRSRGAWQEAHILSKIWRNFNSHAHVERDRVC